MRILWIEDFGEATPETLIRKLFVFGHENEIFAEVLEAVAFDLKNGVTVSDQEWGKAYQEVGEIAHEIRVVVNREQFDEICKSGRLVEFYDVALIDVDLTSRFFDIYPKKVETGIEGKWIYAQLLHSGLPARCLAFLTANQDKVQPIREDLSESLFIDDVAAFGKDGDGPQNLDRWLNERDSKYVRLRRGVLDGERFAWDLVERGKCEVSFPPGSQNEYSRDDHLDYLDRIRCRFYRPDLPPSQSAVLSSYLREIVDPWERAAPKEFNQENRAYSCTLKNARNWVAHQRLSYVTPCDMALIFILHMRAMFNDGSDTLRTYEQVLLRLFAERLPEPPDRNILDQALTAAYLAVWYGYDIKVGRDEKDRKGKHLSWKKPQMENGQSNPQPPREYQYFNEIANQLAEAAEQGEVKYSQLLVQTFWVVLGRLKGSGTTATVSLDLSSQPNWVKKLLAASLRHCFPSKSHNGFSGAHDGIGR